jgi:hypothetical protein
MASVGFIENILVDVADGFLAWYPEISREEGGC